MDFNYSCPTLTEGEKSLCNELVYQHDQAEKRKAAVVHGQLDPLVDRLRTIQERIDREIIVRELTMSRMRAWSHPQDVRRNMRN